MVNAQAALGAVKARIKHMIVLTDGHTSGNGYEALAAQCHAEGITISTVAVGGGAQVPLLQAIAAAGGGQSYQTMDPASITRIFTQDTMVHTGRMIREEAFQPQQVESHPMLKNWTKFDSPPLLGYVKTNRKATSQIPLVTDLGDPLLAHWRYGLGKVTAFTSDCKSRWASLWMSQWGGGYSQLWAQILRETARQPQGQNMDINLVADGDETVCTVDLLEDAGTRKNDANVEADIYFIPSNALGSSMKLVATKEFSQRASGRYVGRFRPEEPGVYLVRAREGAKMVSAGYVHNPSGEVATGRINDTLLKDASTQTGGTYLDSGEGKLTLAGADVLRFVELWPYAILALLFLFMADVAIRRWEHVRGLVDLVLKAKK
jgi:Ca-activated chloride channel family protein